MRKPTSDHAPVLQAERHACALQETEACSALVTRHAVNPLLADGWVGEACSCCCMALMHAHALAATHKLVLAPRLQARLGKALHQVSFGLIAFSNCHLLATRLDKPIHRPLQGLLLVPACNSTC